jgi:hypothetical protein
MDELEWVKWALLSVLGGFIYMLKRELSTKDQDIKELKFEVQHIKTNYLHRDDFKEFKTELRSMFEDLRSDIRAIREKS